MLFTFNTPSRIVFGEGCSGQVGQEFATFGTTKVLIVTGPGSTAHSPALAALTLSLDAESLRWAHFSGAGADPTPAMVAEGVRFYKEERCDAILALGGGSPMDCAKGIGASIGEGRPISDFVGTGRAFTAPVPPLIAVPTTAGTGSEVTGTAVFTLDSGDHKEKKGTSGITLFPKVALVDPLLQASMPPALTAATGMDALTHALECYVGRQHTPIADLYCLESMRLIGRSLRHACHQGDDREARRDMALAATYSGVALSNASLGMVHGFAHALGALCGMAHGLANAIMLPYVMAGCASYPSHPATHPSQDASQDAMERLALAGAALTGAAPHGNGTIDARDTVDAIFSLNADIGIPKSLAAAGVPETMLKSIYDDAKNYKRRPQSPYLFSDEELWELLRAAWSGEKKLR